MAEPTVPEIMERTIPERLRANPELSREIGAVVHFVIGEGQWTLDCTGPEGKVLPGAVGTPKLTLSAAAADFQKVVGKQLNPNMAVMSGKLKLKPMDVGLALKLAKLIG